jgi:phosphoribosylamine--glycine ligase
VLAASGYPEAPRLDDEISGLGTFDPSQTVVFHAGTRRQGRRVHTAGGRVLSVVGRGPNLADARRNAYEAVGHIKFRGRQYRTDIAAPVDREGTTQ